MADARPTTSGPGMPRVPGYAWSWLQRSRPVLEQLAHRLTGGPPTADFLDRLRRDFVTDRFVQGVVIGAIADVAFHGRVPTHRPAGTTWDRGLVWWAAVLAGVTPAEFEARSAGPRGAQRMLFDQDEVRATGPARTGPVAVLPPARVSAERAGLAAALRQLLDGAEGGQVPASAVRQLLADLEAPGEMPNPS